MTSRLRDRFFLIATALGVGALLLASGFAVGPAWSRLSMMMVLFFGSVAAMEVEEKRQRRTKLRRWWPLIVAWLTSVVVCGLVLGWITARFELKWRIPEFMVAMFVGFAIWVFVREPVYRYCTSFRA